MWNNDANYLVADHRNRIWESNRISHLDDVLVLVGLQKLIESSHASKKYL